MHQDHALPFANKRSPAYIQSLLTMVSKAAISDYEKSLEQQLRENPQKPILPQQYRYDVDENVFNKTKLIKI